MTDLAGYEPDRELGELVARYLDNSLDAAARDRLEQRIRDDPAAMDYLAERLRFDATLVKAIRPDRMEFLETRRIVIEPKAGEPGMLVEQQRSVRIGMPHGPAPTIDVHPAGHGRGMRRVALAAGLVLVASMAALWLWPDAPPAPAPVPPPAPRLALRNADFEATALDLSPQGLTSALVDWQDVFFCEKAELVEIGRVSQGAVFAKSGKNVARLHDVGYLTQQLRYTDGSPLKVRDGLKVRLSGWLYPDGPTPLAISASLRVIASGRPDTIQYEACRTDLTITTPGWQRFQIDLHITGNLMREPFWVEPGVQFSPVLDLNGKELYISIDNRASSPLLLDALEISLPGNK